MAMRQMKLNRNFTLDTTFGHSIRFEKGVATNVPPICHHAALAIGAEFVDGDGVIEETPTGPVEPVDPSERKEQLLGAVTKIFERNDIDDFTGAGAPKLEAVNRILGYKVAAKELKDAIQAHYDAVAAEKNG